MYKMYYKMYKYMYNKRSLELAQGSNNFNIVI